jgi:hypothetical protein
MAIKYLLIISFLITLIPITGNAGWVKDTVGQYSWLYEVKVDDGRNDGVQRVYCACLNGHVIEWTYSNGSWTMVDCGTASGGQRLIGLWIGDGRRDGINRLYAACSHGNVYEYTYVDTTWIYDSLGSPGYFYAGVTLGDTRNDDTTRLCAAGYQTPVREYTWDGSSWDTMDISQGNMDIWPIAIGQGRNDGYERIYCPDYTYYALREYTWNGAFYDEESISSPDQLVKVVVGPGRNDGIDRVYGSGKMSHICEFSYDSATWSYQDIHPNAPYLPRFGLCLDRTKSDGYLRLYSNTVIDAVREHSWAESVWVDTIIDAVSGATADLTVGPGRNDDTMRIYTTGDIGYIMEYTNTSPYACHENSSVERPGLNVTILPNPFCRYTRITYILRNDSNVKLYLYDITGREICHLINEFQNKGCHTVDVSSKSGYNTALSAGIYFLKLDCDDVQSVQKVILIE